MLTFRAHGRCRRDAQPRRARGAHRRHRGGGLLGLEAAYGLARAGGQVTVLHLVDRLMERQLDAEGAALLASAMAARGIAAPAQQRHQGLRGAGTDHVEGVELSDGTVIPAELAAIAIGVRPSIDLARSAGLAVDRGILVDDAMATSDPAIFALGECAEHRGSVYGLVEPAYEQARVLASRLAGRPAAYQGSLLATNLKVSGVGVFSAGEFEAGEGAQYCAARSDRSAGIHRKFAPRDGRLLGCVLVGDTQGALFILARPLGG